MAEMLITDLTFIETVLPLAGVMLTQKAPFDGRITEVTMQFPRGCNNLVEVVFGIRRGGSYVSYLPYNGLETETFIALEDAIKPFRVNIKVELDDEVFVQISNTDGVWPHTPSIIVELENDEVRLI